MITLFLSIAPLMLVANQTNDIEKLTLIFSLIAIVVSIWALVFRVKSVKLNKGKNTVDMMTKWCEQSKKETNLAKLIVEKLDETDCEKLYKQEPFKVNSEIKEKICGLCNKRNTPEHCKNCKNDENGDFIIKDLLLTELRWYIIQDLNSLETVLIAWQQGVVDKEIIERQFSTVYDPNNGKTLVEKFRKIVGNGKSYPVIEEFCRQLDKNRKKKEEDERVKQK